MRTILDSYRRGIGDNIAMREDGLIRASHPQYAMTWMDAVVDGRPVTGREGCQVEVNALWYNAVCYTLSLAERYDDEAFAARWRDLPARIREAFMAAFWDENRSYLADYMTDGGERNTDIRPNQGDRLLAGLQDTGRGPAAGHPLHREATPAHAPRTAHPLAAQTQVQGTLRGQSRRTRPRLPSGHGVGYGPWSTTCAPGSTCGAKPSCRRPIHLLAGFEEDLDSYGIGSLPEIYDGDPAPHAARRHFAGMERGRRAAHPRDDRPHAGRPVVREPSNRSSTREDTVMRVLMFGWEFPPHIAGGLGNACYGLTRGLARNGVDVTFVVPKAYGDEDGRFARIVNASDVETRFTEDTYSQELQKRLSFIQIDSPLTPYITPEEYAEGETFHHTAHHTGRTLWQGRYAFAGAYGPNLMEEVARYAIIAGQLAGDLRDSFDVIHAHDWLTYYAGIAAKRASGKPLVVHIHATEFDRSGEHVNQTVYDIERAGMEAADCVIAVSNLTRRIVIERYGIAPEKVVTVHNAVRFASTPDEEVRRGLDDKIVTFLGRITYQKGPDYFVEAAAKVLARVPNVRFVMAGSGDMMPHVVRRVASLGIADRFPLHRLPARCRRQPHVCPERRLCDALRLGAVRHLALEAMRANVPVIISKQSGVAEVLDYALKVDYWDVDALADDIHALISYPALAHLFARKGREEVTGLKWNGRRRQGQTGLRTRHRGGRPLRCPPPLPRKQ